MQVNRWNYPMISRPASVAANEPNVKMAGGNAGRIYKRLLSPTLCLHFANGGEGAKGSPDGSESEY